MNIQEHKGAIMTILGFFLVGLVFITTIGIVKGPTNHFYSLDKKTQTAGSFLFNRTSNLLAQEDNIIIQWDANEASNNSDYNANDYDGDGIENWREIEGGTDPYSADAAENEQLDRTNRDTTNRVPSEVNNNLNQNVNDSDGDGVGDQRERELGTDPDTPQSPEYFQEVLSPVTNQSGGTATGLVPTNSSSNQTGEAGGTYQALAPIPGLTDGGNTPSIGEYLPMLFNWGIAIAVILSVLMTIYGGIKYMTTDAVSGKGEGKQIIQNAITGLLLALSAWLILYQINPQILNLNLNLDSPSNESTSP